MSQTVVERLEHKLSQQCGVKLDLVINENSSIMLNLLEKKRDRARLSIHKMFLRAPEEVIAAVAHYVRGTRRPPTNVHGVIRGYIQQNLSLLDYSHRLKSKELLQKGTTYDLQKIYTRLNQQYFHDTVSCQITWYGNGKRRSRHKVTFGLYLDAYKLIKIHKFLDDPFFPEFFVSFVVYHEMLHHVVKGHLNDQGKFCIHHEAFKNREKDFEDYDKVIAWEKINRNHFFS